MRIIGFMQYLVKLYSWMILVLCVYLWKIEMKDENMGLGVLPFHFPLFLGGGLFNKEFLDIIITL